MNSAIRFLFLVAGLVSEGVVEVLEVIDIEENNRELMMISL